MIMSSRLPTLNLLVLRSDDFEKLKNFYEVLLEVKFEYHKHGNGPYHYSSIIGGIIFEIYKSSENYKQNDSLRLGFMVSKLDSVVDRLAKSNYEVFSYPTIKEWGYQSIIIDTDGRKLELTESTNSN